MKNREAIKSKRFHILLVVLTALIWSAYTFNKTAPFQEGWFVVYSDMIDSGLRPYIDFEFLFFPVYLYLTDLIMNVFGGHLIALRILGATIFIINTIVIYAIIRKMMPEWVAFIASITGMFFSTVNEFYWSYDYHQLAVMFFLLGLLFFVNGTFNDNRKKTNFLISGVCCATIVFFKPTALIVLCCAIVLLLLQIMLKKDAKPKELLYFIGGYAAVFIIFAGVLAGYGLLEPFMGMAFHTDVKGGSAIDLVFSFIKNYVPPYYVIVIAVTCLLIYTISKKKCHLSETNNSILYVSFALFLVIIITAIIIPKTISKVPLNVNIATILATIVFITIISVCISFINLLRKKEEDNQKWMLFTIVGAMIIALEWAALSTGPIHAMYIAPVVAYAITYMVYALGTLDKRKIRVVGVIVILIVSSFLVFAPVSIKNECPYHWWGDAAEPYYECTESIDIDYFIGIRTSTQDKEIYEDFKNISNEIMTENDTMYCFVSNQIFYHIAGKIPTVYAPMCWYDVSTEAGIARDVEYLKNNNPKMIVFQDVGLESIIAHEKEFGYKAAHRDLYNWLSYCKDDPSSGYHIERTYIGDYNTYILVKA